MRQKNDEANYVYWSYSAPRELNKVEYSQSYLRARFR